MKLHFALLLSATIIAAACGSSKKSQSSGSSTNSTSSSGKKGDYQMLDDNTFQLSGISEDATYGYKPENAIKVGNGSKEAFGGGPVNQRRFLNALLGPDGESVTYDRRGSCCAVKSDYGFMGSAMLDIYEVMYSGLKEPIRLYINMYDPGDDLKAPKGFTFRK